ncbi:hypothetical protein AMK20_27250 [Streptomyces sp. TSRI0261]|nr:hypothetical protein AMK20_27250 [Streptomyces sp. TSRI0261]
MRDYGKRSPWRTETDVGSLPSQGFGAGTISGLQPQLGQLSKRQCIPGVGCLVRESLGASPVSSLFPNLHEFV